MAADFKFTYHGSITILVPKTRRARKWVAENLPEDAQTWAGGTVIEFRYTQPIVAGIVADGLTLE